MGIRVALTRKGKVVRKALFQLHLWIGVGVGLYILLICASGSLIVFRREFDHTLCPRIIMVSGPGRQLTQAQLRAKAVAAYPRADFKQVEIRGARVPGAAVEVWFLGGTYRLERLFDPYTGKNLNDTVACEPRFVTWLADLHDNLTRGRSGLLVNGVGAIVIVVMSVSGLVLWWPGTGCWRHGLTLHRNVGRTPIRAATARRDGHLVFSVDCPVGNHGNLFRVSGTVQCCGRCLYGGRR